MFIEEEEELSAKKKGERIRDLTQLYGTKRARNQVRCQYLTGLRPEVAIIVRIFVTSHCQDEWLVLSINMLYSSRDCRLKSLTL